MNRRETEGKEAKGVRENADDIDDEDSETETECAETHGERAATRRTNAGFTSPAGAKAILRKRKSLEDASSGSTDSEWDKVSEASELER